MLEAQVPAVQVPAVRVPAARVPAAWVPAVQAPAARVTVVAALEEVEVVEGRLPQRPV